MALSHTTLQISSGDRELQSAAGADADVADVLVSPPFELDSEDFAPSDLLDAFEPPEESDVLDESD